jgi:hypothetical protein
LNCVRVRREGFDGEGLMNFYELKGSASSKLKDRRIKYLNAAGSAKKKSLSGIFCELPSPPAPFA